MTQRGVQHELELPWNTDRCRMHHQKPSKCQSFECLSESAGQALHSEHLSRRPALHLNWREQQIYLMIKRNPIYNNPTYKAQSIRWFKMQPMLVSTTKCPLLPCLHHHACGPLPNGNGPHSWNIQLGIANSTFCQLTNCAPLSAHYRPAATTSGILSNFNHYQAQSFQKAKMLIGKGLARSARASPQIVQWSHHLRWSCMHVCHMIMRDPHSWLRIKGNSNSEEKI